MISRVDELEARNALLVTHCAEQREAVAKNVAAILAGSARIDRELVRIRRWAAQPIAIAAAVAAVIVLLRFRPLRTVTAMLAVAVPAMRWTALGRRFRREIDGVC